METNQTYQNELGSAMLPFVMRELVDTECHFKLSGMAVYSVERNGDFVVMDNKTAQT